MKYDSGVIDVLLKLLTKDVDWISRIVETFEVLHTRVRRSVSMTLTLPDVGLEAESPLLLPVTQVKRGLLIDNLDVEDASGRSLSVLSRLETRNLFRLIVQAEFNRALAQALKRPDGTQKPISEFDWVVLARAREILGDIPSAPPDLAKRFYRSVFDESEVLPALSGLVSEVSTDKGLRRLVGFLRNNAIKVIEVRGFTPGERTIIKYSYDSYYENTESKSLNRTLGQRPYTFRFYTPLAFVAPSYHVRMQAPEGHYCSEQSFEVRIPTVDDAIPAQRQGRRRVKPLFIPWEALYEKSPERGLPYAHLYVTGLDSAEQQNITARIQFFEFPPGQLGIAFGFATLAFVLFVAVGATFSQVVNNVEGGALFLAVVGFTAVWMRPTFDARRLLQAPLSAKVALVTTGVLGLLGSLDLVICSSLKPLSGTGLWAGRAAMWFLGVVALVVAEETGRRVWKKQRAAPV